MPTFKCGDLEQNPALEDWFSYWNVVASAISCYCISAVSSSFLY